MSNTGSIRLSFVGKIGDTSNIVFLGTDYPISFIKRFPQS